MLAQFEKSVILQCMDNHWREHLAAMDYLRQGIHLRGYAQKDPKQEYKREAFTLFTSMLDHLKYDIIKLLSSVEIKTEEDVGAIEQQRRSEQAQKMQYIHEDNSQAVELQSSVTTFKRNEKKVGRNDVCPCGSGKKFKACHGSLA